MEHMRRVHSQELGDAGGETQLSVSGEPGLSFNDEDTDMESDDGEPAFQKVEVGHKNSSSEQKTLLQGKLLELKEQRAKVEGDIMAVERVLSFM